MDNISVVNPLTVENKPPAARVTFSGKMFIYCIDCKTYHENVDQKKEVLYHSRKKLITQQSLQVHTIPTQNHQGQEKLYTLSNEKAVDGHRKKLSLTYQPVLTKQSFSLDLLGRKKMSESVQKPEKGVTLSSKLQGSEYMLTQSPQKKEPSGEVHRIGKSGSKGKNLLQSKIRKLQPKLLQSTNNPEVHSRKIQVQTAKIRKLKTTSENI